MMRWLEGPFKKIAETRGLDPGSRASKAAGTRRVERTVHLPENDDEARRTDTARRAVTCQCVVAFEKLRRVPGLAHVNARNQSLDRMRMASDEVFARLYASDAALHRRAKAHAEFCYRPPAQPEVQ